MDELAYLLNVDADELWWHLPTIGCNLCPFCAPFTSCSAFASRILPVLCRFGCACILSRYVGVDVPARPLRLGCINFIYPGAALTPPMSLLCSKACHGSNVSPWSRCRLCTVLWTRSGGSQPRHTVSLGLESLLQVKPLTVCHVAFYLRHDLSCILLAGAGVFLGHCSIHATSTVVTSRPLWVLVKI